MTKTVEFEYTDTFNNATDNLISYLTSFSDEISVINKIVNLTERFENKVTIAPYSCQISPSLQQQLGITLFREYTNDGLRLIYRVIEKNDKITIKCEILLSQRQDIQQALVDYCLLHR